MDEPLIYIVDDEPNVLASLKRFLINEGYSVVTFADGSAALAALTEKAAAVILTDYMMPGISGIEVLQKAREISPWMEDIDESGRSSYLIPKGAKRKVVGSQVIIEPPSEYVARRLYEIEEYLQRRFKTIEGRQEKFRKELEELKRSIGRLEKDNRFSQDLEALKGAVEEFSEFKRIMEIFPYDCLMYATKHGIQFISFALLKGLFCVQ